MPPSLVIGVHPKPVILVLNKIDLIPPPLALAWKSYFQERYSNVRVTFFTSCPAYNLRNITHYGTIHKMFSPTTNSESTISFNEYRTRAIITRGLYIYYPNFEVNRSIRLHHLDIS